MAQQPGKGARWIVLVFLVALIAGVFVATLRNSGRPPAQEGAPAAQAGSAPAAPAESPGTPSASGGAAANPAQPEIPKVPTPLTGLSARPNPDPAAAWDTIGGLDPKAGPLLQISFSPRGAGIGSLRLARYFTSIRHDEHVEVQSELAVSDSMILTPMAILGVSINGSYVDLKDPKVWKQVSPGRFEATIVDPANADVARVEREFAVDQDTYTVRVNQRLVNLTDKPQSVRFYQLGPTDLPKDKVTYGGERRRVRFGYLVDPNSDPSRQLVLSADTTYLLDRTQLIGSPDPSTNLIPISKAQWPNARSVERGYELVWAALSNRYFGAAVFPLLPVQQAQPLKKAFSSVDTLDRVYLRAGPRVEDPDAVGLRLTSVEMPAPANGGAADFSMAFFAGPQSGRAIAKDPLASAAGIAELVLFNFGGMCACCTFAWLTQPLLSLLAVLHDYITHDWSLAIMLLVLIVRGVLHPVTRWSQIRVQRFSKQMQGIAPKMQKLKEKYESDPKMMQAETARLWREEGISPTGMLGCLPMFLQTPVWIALSAMLFFTIEIRHQSAFFGLFQSFGSPQSPVWFFGDLAEPDRLIYFGRTLFTVPLLGEISSINIMPLVLGVLFYAQQKYMTPAPTTQMTPEQEMQMKMMKWMTVFMFPLMMYNAPSGLALYFFTNSVLGIAESKWIKRYIDRHDLLNLDKMKEERQQKKGGGFFAKLQKMAEERQKIIAQQQERARRKGGR